MKLNLVLLRDWLQNTTILDAECRSHALHFDRPLCYVGGEMRPSSLYICRAEDLPEEPPFLKSDHVSVIVIGDLPTAWRGKCEYLSVSPAMTFPELLNHVTAVFLFFQKWELSLSEMIRSGASLRAVGKALFDVVGNPVDFVTNFFKEVIQVTDPRKRLPAFFTEFYKEGEFLSEDELQIVFADPEYRRSLQTKSPAIFSKTIYGYRMLYQNLFVDGEYIGRLVVSELYREIRESDYSLLSFFSRFFLDVYVRTQTQNIGLTGQLEKMVEVLLAGEDYHPEYDTLLAGRNWRRTDSYLCLALRQQADQGRVSMVNSAVYLSQQFPLCMTYSRQDRILLILNESHTKDQPRFFNQVKQFCENNGFSAGISLPFSGFEQFKTHCGQAETALRIGQKAFVGRKICYYSEIILEQMLDVLKKETDQESRLSRPVRRLVDFDAERGAELVKTLRVSLQNHMNATHSAKALSLSRTAYLNRMERISDITGYDLSDYRTRLYLMLLFELETEGQQSV